MSMNVRLCYQKSLYSQTILVFTNARTFQAFLDAPAEMAIKSEETSVKVRIAIFGVGNSTSSLLRSTTPTSTKTSLLFKILKGQDNKF